MRQTNNHAGTGPGRRLSFRCLTFQLPVADLGDFWSVTVPSIVRRGFSDFWGGFRPLESMMEENLEDRRLLLDDYSCGEWFYF